jgi:S1-C subfamily serine protease
MILFGEMGGQWTMWFRPVEEFVSALDNIPASPDQVAPLAWIGAISMEGVPENLWEINGMTTPGVKLHDVIPGHPAQKAGLATGDIIVGVKGQPLAKYPTPNQTAKEFARTMARLGVGASVEVDVIRNSKPMRAVLTLQPGLAPRSAERWCYRSRKGRCRPVY